MKDEMIVEMYWRRDERAIEESDKKYGQPLFRLAYNILSDAEDSKECLNDTYLRAWSSIPPNRPHVLYPYLSKLVRQTSIDLFRRKSRKKRVTSQYTQSLSELEECVSKGDELQENFDEKILIEMINRWLKTLTPEARIIFLRRYYFMDSIKELSMYCGLSESKIKSRLFRLRGSLKKYLEREGYYL